MKKTTTNNTTVTATVETITPEMAGRYLEHNIRNRRISTSALTNCIYHLISGQWMVNGDSIKFSNTNALLDGQHRLRACVETGRSFVSVVVRGLDDSAFATIDSGKTRTAADVLTIGKVPHASQMAAAAKRLFAVHHAGDKSGTWAARFSCLDMQGRMPSHADIVQLHHVYAQRMSDALDWIRINKYPLSILPDSLLIFLDIRLSEINADVARTFLEQLITNTDEDAKTAAKLLRSRIINEAFTTTKTPMTKRVLQIARCFLSDLEGRSPSQALKNIKDATFPVLPPFVLDAAALIPINEKANSVKTTILREQKNKEQNESALADRRRKAGKKITLPKDTPGLPVTNTNLNRTNGGGAY